MFNRYKLNNLFLVFLKFFEEAGFFLIFFWFLGYSLAAVVFLLLFYGFFFDFIKTFSFVFYYIAISFVFFKISIFVSRSEAKLEKVELKNVLDNKKLIIIVIFLTFSFIIFGNCSIYSETLPIAAKVFEVAKPAFSALVHNVVLKTIAPNLAFLDMSDSVSSNLIKTVMQGSPKLFHPTQLSSLVTSQVISSIMDLPVQKQALIFNGVFNGFQDLCSGAHPTSTKPEIIDHCLVKINPFGGLHTIIASGKGHLFAGKNGFSLNNYTLLDDLAQPKLLIGEDRLIRWIADIVAHTNIGKGKVDKLLEFLNLFPYSFAISTENGLVKLDPSSDSDLNYLLSKLETIGRAYSKQLNFTETMLVYAGPDSIDFNSIEIKKAIEITGNNYNLFIKTPCLSKLK